MTRMKVLRPIDVRIIGILLVPLMVLASVAPVPVLSQPSATTVNVTEIWGKLPTGTDTVIYSNVIEPSASVKSYIDSSNKFRMFDNHTSIISQVYDFTKSSFGLHSTEWSTKAGKGYWHANASTSLGKMEAGATGKVTASIDTTYGYVYNLWIDSTSGSDLNSDNDYVTAYVNTSIDILSTTYAYVLVTFVPNFNNASAPDETKHLLFGFYASDGFNKYLIAFAITNSTSETFAGDSPIASVGSGPVVAGEWRDYDTVSGSHIPFGNDVLGAQIYYVSTSILNNQEYTVGLLLNIQDIINKDPEPSDRITATKITQILYGASVAYWNVNDLHRISVRQFLLGDAIEEFSLHETVTQTDNSEKKMNNLINGTNLILSEPEKYPLKNGFTFTTGFPINALTLSSYDVIVSPINSEFVLTSEENLYTIREDTFDTSFPSAERIQEPSTWYLNISSLSTDYEILQLTVSGEDAFSSDGSLNSGWTIEDKDGVPTINEISDIYNDITSITGDLKVLPASGISNSNELTVRIKYYIQPSDLDSLLSLGFFTGLGRQIMKAVQVFLNTPWMVGMSFTIVMLGGAFIFVKKTETPIEVRAKKWLGIKKK